MASKFEGNIFPTPPSFRPRSARPLSLVSTRNGNDRALESSPPILGRSNSQRSSATHELATQADIRLILEYLMRVRQDLDAEKQKREEDVSALRNQSQDIYDSFTATSRRQHERAAAFKSLMQDQTRKVDKLQKRATAMETTTKDVQLQMQEVAKVVQSDSLRKLMNVMPLGSHGENVWSAQCIFVLNAARPNTFEVDGVAYLKLQHGRPAQKVTFNGDSEGDFIQTVERNFAVLLKDRSWMPLAAWRVGAHTQARVTLDRLTAKDREAGTWTRQFLDEHCTVLDSKGRAHIYLALQNALLMLAEIQSLVGDDSSAASGDAAHQHKPLRPSNGPPWPRSSAAIGGSYTVGNSFSPPQSSLTSSRTSIEAEGSLLSSETKRPTPPANHAVARQVSNVTHKPSILSTLSTAVSSSHASQEIERDAQQRAPAPDTAVIGCIDYATNGALEKTQGSDGGVTALPTAISSPATSFGSSPTLVSSPTPSLVSRRPSHKESSLRQRLFKGSKPKTPMASPKSSYEALSQPQLASGPAQGPKPTAISLQNPAQPPASTVGSSPKSSLLELSLFQDTPQPLQQPVSRTTSRKSSLRSPQVPPTEKLHSPLRIQGRAKSPHPSPRPASKPASSTHARQPSTQSKRTTRSVASKISKISKPRSRSQSRSRRSSSSRQQNNGDNGGPLDWSYQLKEATASKESLRIKRAQEVERKAMVEKLGMRPVRVAKGGFWRRTFGRR